MFVMCISLTGNPVQLFAIILLRSGHRIGGRFSYTRLRKLVFNFQKGKQLPSLDVTYFDGFDLALLVLQMEFTVPERDKDWRDPGVSIGYPPVCPDGRKPVS